MATLEKIRSKSVFLLIIIGLALLAFIIGDFFTSGRTLFGTGTTVAKVGTTKIDIQDFQHEMEKANQQVQNSGQKVDPAMLQQQVLSGMISEKLFKEELNKLGIVVTDQELTDMLLGNGSAQIDRMVQQQVGVESARQLHDMAFNPGKYEIPLETSQQLQAYWVNLEKQAEESLLQQKFINLLNGTLVANELDAKALYDENGTTTQVIYASVPYSTLPDADFEVSDADVQNEWNAHKAVYKLDEQMRTINYISVDIAPSQEDIAKGEKRVEDALLGLAEKDGLEGIAEFTDFISDRRKLPANTINDARIKAFADSASVGQAKMISRMGNNFTLAKMFGRTSEVDSVNIDMVMVAGDKAQIDSVLVALKSGLAADSLQAKFNYVQGAQDSIWVSLTSPNMANYKNVIANANTGTYFLADSAATGNGLILRVNNRKPAVSVIDIAMIDFTIEPSLATINNLQTKLQDFVNANPKAAEFNKNAAEAGYQTIPARVTASTPGLTGLNDTREVIAWAMKAKTGAVSPVFGSETTGHLIAAALDNIYKDYVPATDSQVKQMLTAKVRNDKKADNLIGKYNGKAKNVEGYAKLMNSKVDSAQVTFGQISPYNPGFGGAEVSAIATVTPKGTTTPALKGLNGVYVVEVVGVETNPRPYSYEENALMYARTRGAQALNLNNVLIGNKKVTNNLLKFFQN